MHTMLSSLHLLFVVLYGLPLLSGIAECTTIEPDQNGTATDSVTSIPSSQTENATGLLSTAADNLTLTSEDSFLNVSDSELTTDLEDFSTEEYTTEEITTEEYTTSDAESTTITDTTTDADPTTIPDFTTDPTNLDLTTTSTPTGTTTTTTSAPAVTTTATESATTSTISTSTLDPRTTTQIPTPPLPSGLQGGALIGIGCGLLLLGILIGCGGHILIKRCRNNHGDESSASEKGLDPLDSQRAQPNNYEDHVLSNGGQFPEVVQIDPEPGTNQADPEPDIFQANPEPETYQADPDPCWDLRLPSAAAAPGLVSEDPYINYTGPATSESGSPPVQTAADDDGIHEFSDPVTDPDYLAVQSAQPQDEIVEQQTGGAAQPTKKRSKKKKKAKKENTPEDEQEEDLYMNVLTINNEQRLQAMREPSYLKRESAS